MKNPTLANLIDRIDAAQRIALILHVSPDGDTCGSALALRRALLFRDKDVTCACDNAVPHIYRGLDGADAVVAPGTLKGQRFDLSIAIDVADRDRMGESLAVFDAGDRTAQIDHHHTNPGYAEANYIRSPLSATGVLTMEVIDALGVPLDLAIAENIFVAVATDTGNFKQENTDGEALRIAARCVDAGVNPAKITRRVFDLRPPAQIGLMARAFASLTTYEDGRLAIMRLTAEDFSEVGALPEHTEGIVNFAINTEGVEIACLMSRPAEKVRCSLRCLPPHDVSIIACALGGGGHAAAAGCTMEPPLEDAQERMLVEMKKELYRQR